MIISHRHRFIFIRTIKTASTTVEIFLRHYCGPDDIVTPLYADEEALADPEGINGPRNYGRSLLAPWKVRRKDLRWMRAHRRYPRDDRFSNHISAALIKARIGDDIWNSYTKITIVRDPWDRAVSLHYWRNRDPDEPGLPLDEVVEHAGGNWRIYTIDGRSEIDFFIRYETLQTDLEALRDRLGLGGEVNLVQAKSGIRPQRSSARELLTEPQAQRIAELAQNEIEMFGYRWSDTNGDATT